VPTFGWEPNFDIRKKPEKSFWPCEFTADLCLKNGKMPNSGRWVLGGPSSWLRQLHARKKRGIGYARKGQSWAMTKEAIIKKQRRRGKREGTDEKQVTKKCRASLQ